MSPSSALFVVHRPSVEYALSNYPGEKVDIPRAWKQSGRRREGVPPRCVASAEKWLCLSRIYAASCHKRLSSRNGVAGELR